MSLHLNTNTHRQIRLPDQPGSVLVATDLKHHPPRWRRWKARAPSNGRAKLRPIPLELARSRKGELMRLLIAVAMGVAIGWLAKGG